MDFLPSDAEEIVQLKQVLNQVITSGGGTVTFSADVREFQSYYLTYFIQTVEPPNATTYNAFAVNLFWEDSSGGIVVFHDRYEQLAEQNIAGTFGVLNGTTILQGPQHGPFMLVQFQNFGIKNMNIVSATLWGSTRQVGQSWKSLNVTPPTPDSVGTGLLFSATGINPPASTTTPFPIGIGYGKMEMTFLNTATAAFTVGITLRGIQNWTIQNISVPVSATVVTDLWIPKKQLTLDIKSGVTPPVTSNMTVVNGYNKDQ